MSGHNFSSPGSNEIIFSAFDLFIVTFKSRYGSFEFNFVICPVVKALIPVSYTQLPLPTNSSV